VWVSSIHYDVNDSITYVLRHVRAFRDVAAGSVSETLVPDQILSAVEAAPVPVSSHHRTDEVGVICMRSFVVVEVARLDLMGECSYHSGGQDGGKCSEGLHIVVDVVH
jgi:hypothetical protein